MSRKKPQMGVQPPRQPRWSTAALFHDSARRREDTIKIRRPAYFDIPGWTTVHSEDGVDYQMMTARVPET